MNTINSLSVAALLRKTGANQAIVSEFANYFANANSHFCKKTFIADASRKFRRFRHGSGSFTHPSERYIEQRPDGWVYLDGLGRIIRKDTNAIAETDIERWLQCGLWIEVF